MLAMLCRNGVDAFYERASEREMMELLHFLRWNQYKNPRFSVSLMSPAFFGLCFMSRLFIPFPLFPPSASGSSLRGSAERN
jgi:hypothetical protein